VERRVGVPLEECRGDLDVDVTLDGALDDTGLVLTRRNDRDLSRIENRRDAHRDRFARHVLLAEEIGCRVATRDGIERDEARGAVGARAGLVESDVARLADAKDLEVDPAGASDLELVSLRRVRDLGAWNVARRDVDVLALDIDA